jgi:dCMP deaminase
MIEYLWKRDGSGFDIWHALRADGTQPICGMLFGPSVESVPHMPRLACTRCAEIVARRAPIAPLPERPTFHDIYMNMAHEVARRSTCARTSSEGEPMHVGCVIVSPDFRKVVSLGYNGNAAGLPNECDSDQPGNCGCIHAEANAAVNCDVPRQTPKIVFCTHLPCIHCAKLLINLGGVQQVYFRKDYRIRTSIDLFTKVGIGVSSEFP